MPAAKAPSPSTRQRILAGASSAMLKKGLHQVAVRDILEAAQVSRRTFYQHFSDTNALLLALHAEQNQALIAKVGQAISAVKEPMERLRCGVDAYLDLQGEYPLFSRLQAEAMRPDSVLFAGREQTIHGLIQVIAQTHQALFDLKLDPYVFRTLIVGIEGLTIHTGHQGPLSDRERQRVQSAVQLVLRAVLMPKAS